MASVAPPSVTRWRSGRGHSADHWSRGAARRSAGGGRGLPHRPCLWGDQRQAHLAFRLWPFHAQSRAASAPRPDPPLRSPMPAHRPPAPRESRLLATTRDGRAGACRWHRPVTLTWRTHYLGAVTFVNRMVKVQGSAGAGFTTATCSHNGSASCPPRKLLHSPTRTTRSSVSGYVTKRETTAGAAALENASRVLPRSDVRPPAADVPRGRPYGIQSRFGFSPADDGNRGIIVDAFAERLARPSGDFGLRRSPRRWPVPEWRPRCRRWRGRPDEAYRPHGGWSHSTGILDVFLPHGRVVHSRVL
jgi:hypothetical protein